MNKMIEVAATDPSDNEGRVNGIVDRPTSGRIAGWAIDRADPSSHVIVDILYEGALIGQVPATEYRKDLKGNGIGTGKYGFKFDLSDRIDAEMSFAITAVARTKDGICAPSRNTGRMAQSEDPAIRMSQRSYLNGVALRRDVMQMLHELSAENQDKSPGTDITDSLDRIELVQARLEELLSKADTVEPSSQPAGLKWAVAIALLFGLSSFALGVVSLWMG